MNYGSVNPLPKINLTTMNVRHKYPKDSIADVWVNKLSATTITAVILNPTLISMSESKIEFRPRPGDCIKTSIKDILLLITMKSTPNSIKNQTILSIMNRKYGESC